MKKLLAVALVAFCCAGFLNADIYVAPDGNDSATGAADAPVKSVKRAVELSFEKNDPQIVFADGTYFLDGSLKLTSKHSGTEEQPRTFRAANEGAAVFSAGMPVDLEFETHQGEILQATIPDNVDLSMGVDGLVVETRQQRMARFPNYDRSARWLKGCSREAFSPQRIATWSDPAGGYLHSMHRAHWGGNHWKITGKKSPTECTLEGGWMNNRGGKHNAGGKNNRGGEIHPTDRFVENIFEELDAPGEWYLNQKTRTLYWWPDQPVEKRALTVVLSRHESCVALEGTEDSPVRHIAFDGISFRHCARTFMKTDECLLRSDWCIYRGGALLIKGAEDVRVSNCEFTQLGGNALFASGYNRRIHVRGCHFHQIGAGAVNFVGDTAAVYNGRIDPYGAPDPWEKINKTDRGPKTNNYPADCIAEDCLIHDIGLVEKQVAGLQISVAARVTGRHLSIYDVPRAGINISENAFGGHLIEFCDVFDTVQESSDHGSFNSWGRDRYWHTNYRKVDEQVARFPELPKIDMLEKNVIRNSRWRCDHGWDIDLDDGSSWYVVENNLCLGGGIKLREGYYRVVRNNLIVANTFHPHVWFKKCDDVFEHNIVATPYQPISIRSTGKRWDSNLFLSQQGLSRARDIGVDVNSLATTLNFTDPATLDFTFDADPAVERVGFKPFDLTRFGVQKASLKSIARTPTPPQTVVQRAVAAAKYQVLGATFKKITTYGEASATGMGEIQGVYVTDVAEDSFAAEVGLQSRDVVLSVVGQKVNSPAELLSVWGQADRSRPIPVDLWRTQKAAQAEFPAFPGVVLTAADATIHGSAVYDAKKNYIGRWTEPTDALQWEVKLKPSANYSMILTQAADTKHPSQWSLTGLSQPVEQTTYSTSGWEVFESRQLKGTATANDEATHTLRIEPIKINHAVMNFRELILVEM